MKISDIRLNPNNPRLIKDDRFKKLVQSIQDFPAMMELRPIVVNPQMVILGGNMRYRACKELGMKTIPDEWVKIATKLTPEEEKRFIIEDNVPFGEWDYDILANEWNVDELGEWGLYTYFTGIEENGMGDDEVNINEEFDPYGDMKDYQRVVFIFKTAKDAEKYLKQLNVQYKKMNMAWQVDMTSQSI